jgi:hypothetical protein
LRNEIVSVSQKFCRVWFVGRARICEKAVIGTLIKVSLSWHSVSFYGFDQHRFDGDITLLTGVDTVVSGFEIGAG